ncbi:hypothetical protein Tco_1417057 [Tanacetum coccineum]
MIKDVPIMGNIESLIQVIANKPHILPRIILGRKVVVIMDLETSYASINLSFVLSVAILALNVANDSLLEEDSKAERLVALPLSLDPKETFQIKALVIPASREKKDLAKPSVPRKRPTNKAVPNRGKTLRHQFRSEFIQTGARLPLFSVTTHSNDPLLSGEDILKLNELMKLYTNLSQRVIDLENTKTSQAAEITKLKERVKKLDRRNKSRIPGLKRLRNVGRTARIKPSEDEDEEVSFIDETQGRNDDNLMFDTGVLDEQKVEVEKVDSTV